MNASAEKKPDEVPARKLRPWQHVVHWALIALVLYTCYWAARTVKRIVAGPQNAPVVEEPVMSTAPAFQALSETPDPGYWAFADQDWNVAQTRLAPHEFEQHLLDRLENKTENSPASRQFLSVFQSLGSPAALGEHGKLYRAGADGGPFAVTRGEGDSEQLVVAGLVMPEEGGTWQILEMLPTLPTTQKKKSSSASLLPLPPQAQRLMARWSNEEKLLLDWVHVPVPAEVVVRDWQAAGLKLRATTGMLGAESSYLYEHQGEVIIVNTFPSTEGGADLLITRSTDVVPSSAAGFSDRTP